MFSIFKRSKKENIPEQEIKKEQAKQAAQHWMPIEDVYNDLIHRKDGQMVAVIRVMPLNMPLLSKNEQKRKIKSLFEVYNGYDGPKKILTIARPVDLDGYIMKLEEQKNRTDNFTKKKILEEDRRRAAMMSSDGEAVDRHFFVMIMGKKGANPQFDMDILLKKAHELAMNFSGASLSSHVCSDQELRDLLFIFGNPGEAAFERAPVHNGPYLFDQNII